MCRSAMSIIAVQASGRGDRARRIHSEGVVSDDGKVLRNRETKRIPCDALDSSGREWFRRMNHFSAAVVRDALITETDPHVGLESSSITLRIPKSAPVADCLVCSKNSTMASASSS